MTKIKSIFVAAFALVAFSNVTNAQAIPTSYSVGTETAAPFKVKYLGSDGQYLLFNVTLEQSNEGNAKFSIDDNRIGEIYSTGYSSNLKLSTVKIEKGEIGQVLNFKLSFGKKTYSKAFSVDTKLVETTTVAERDVTKL